MQGGEFVDTNIVLYLLSKNQVKADLAERILKRGPVISVQVLNELVNVCRRKLSMNSDDIAELDHAIQEWCDVRDITLTHHQLAVSVMTRHNLSFYDSLIVASALEADCNTLYSEDLQHGMKIAGQLTIKNPFKI